MVAAYVVGLDPYNLLNIQYRLNFIKERVEIETITHGIDSIHGATIIDDIDEAKRIIKEIQARYEEIHIRTDDIIDGILHGNDIDPMQLRIYQVRVGWEVKV